jgi:DNA-binding NarL/FixJ family response regulator
MAGLGNNLTQREIEVARLAVEGLTRKEIAARLYIAENAVKIHIAHIYAKLGAHNRLQMEHKLPAPPPVMTVA